MIETFAKHQGAANSFRQLVSGQRVADSSSDSDCDSGPASFPLCVCFFGAWQRAAVMSVNLLHFLLHIIFKLSVASCKLIHFQATDLHAPIPIGIGIEVGVPCALYCFDFNLFGFEKQSHSLRNCNLAESLLTISFPACCRSLNLFRNLLKCSYSSVSVYLRLYQ